MDSRPRYSLTTGIPAVRVGWLIGQARRAAALDERGLAKAVGVGKRTIRRWETARQVPCDSEIEAIANACHRNIAELLPARDVVEFDAGARYLRVGGQSVSVADVHNDAVLTTYVALVREQRQLGEGDKVTFRQPDLDVLSEALDLDDDSLETRLRRIAGLDENDAAEVRRRLVRRRLAMPAVGLLAGSWGLARLAAAENPAPVTDPAAASVGTTNTTAPTTYLDATSGTGSTVTVLDVSSTTIATATAVVAPTPNPAATPAPPATRPVVRTHPSTVATVEPALAPVIADAVDVANITPEIVEPQLPVESGTAAPEPSTPQPAAP